MKRPIKFRGRVSDSDKLDGGKVVFGSLVDYGKTETNLLGASSRFWINPIDGDRNFPVEENSISQLVGFDSDGNEVYEGDLLETHGGDLIADMSLCAAMSLYKLKEGNSA